MRTITVLLALLLVATVVCLSCRPVRIVRAVGAHAQEPQPLGPGMAPPRVIAPVDRLYPQYSDTARRLGIEGTVIVEAIVQRDGSISVMGTRGNLGYGLDENAILAVRHVRLLRATKDSQPIDVSLEIPVEFRLDDVRENPRFNVSSFVRQPGCASMKAAQPIFRIQPQYTDIAKRDRINGTVSLDVIVRADGRVDVSRVAESLDHGLDMAAADAVSQWILSPRICDGAAAEARLTLQVNFNLR